MKVLVIGSGGREHALVWKLAQSDKVKAIYVAPGNPGISQLANCVDISANNIEALLQFAQDNSIDLTVVGPEQPLAAGIVDCFEDAGLTIFGPNKDAAQIEASKVFAKNLMKKHHIPTAAYETFSQYEDALEYLNSITPPLVIKADGLAAGKGVILAESVAEAQQALHNIMVNEKFGSAGEKVIIEEFLQGQEVSLLAFTDGKTIVPMVSAQDHKQAYDGDKGPNTGGMGAYSPAPALTANLTQQVIKDILEPTVIAMEAEGCPYKGVLYAGLMLTSDGPKVLEFNCRFGDPETQVVLPRLQNDLVEIMLACTDQTLHQLELEWSKQTAVCVILASGGYPLAYEKGKKITGVEDVADNAIVFHAGTRQEKGTLYTNGGRVLGVTVLDDNLNSALDKAYVAVGEIHFAGMHYRSDIGVKALK